MDNLEVEQEFIRLRAFEQGREVFREENAKLRRVVDAAQAFMNEIQCYSAGVSLMAEEDMVELFAAYSDAKDKLGGEEKP